MQLPLVDVADSVDHDTPDVQGRQRGNLHVHPDRVVLHPENPAYPDVEVPSLSTLHIWGVVVYGIRHLNQRKLH